MKSKPKERWASGDQSLQEQPVVSLAASLVGILQHSEGQRCINKATKIPKGGDLGKWISQVWKEYYGCCVSQVLQRKRTNRMCVYIEIHMCGPLLSFEDLGPQGALGPISTHLSNYTLWERQGTVWGPARSSPWTRSLFLALSTGVLWDVFLKHQLLLSKRL